MKAHKKLIGDETERAVSPVIGVILMVAITVILAAVIAAFVLDVGQSVDQEAQAGVAIDVDQGDQEIRVEVTSLGNADHVNVTNIMDHERYDGEDDENASLANLEVGDTVTIDDEYWEDNEPVNGTISAVAVIEESGTETSVASEDFDFDDTS